MDTEDACPNIEKSCTYIDAAIAKMISDGVHPFAVAALLMTTAYRIYELNLSYEEYIDIINTIANQHKALARESAATSGPLH